ncbi:hypothetical protein D7B24_007462 [Verticillium nonalfalfae]|uniref:DNA repair protein rad16 n=1 Tax=Verticillium nonalfalfae TaxID=1051616 RepID=A0A3M9YJF6_9PEZI|nr:uncharacterized protein D7B24_007462 [Verticillium nonalfalfae]RNJ60539.1 hypothetical protein D7B24_007462 [Verticillium nonalfalfae]
MAPRKARTSAAHSLASRPETPESSRSRRMTRSTSTQKLSSAVSLPPVDAIEPLSVVVRGSKSTTSASTSATFTSASEASTPATSHEVTPAPPAADEKSASTRPMMSRLEVQIPVMERAPSERATRNTRFSLARASKRSSNTYEVLDSDEDELAFDTPPDEIIARRLQKEEYEKMDMPALVSTSRPGRGLRASLDRTPVVKGKRGRPSKSPLSASIERPTKKQKLITDSEDDALSDDANGQASSSDLSEALSIKTESDDFEAPEETGEDDSSDDMVEVARPRSGALPKKKRPTRPNAPQGFRSAATLPLLPSSEPDDDDFDPDQSDEELPELADASARINLDDSHDFVLGRRARRERDRLERHHPELDTMWTDLEARPAMSGAEAVQPTNITRQLKPFQLKGVAWMKEMEMTDWKGGLLGDEMGLGKTLQSVSLIMSDHGSIKKPSLVLVPPVALMQWTNEIASYTDGTLKTFVFHGTNTKVKNVTAKELKKFDVIMMSYNSLESMFRKQEKGFNQRKKGEVHKQKSIIHQIDFHRIILDEAHYIKGRDTGTARACIALKGDYRWCLTGTPLQNRIGELFSLVRFLNITPFASYLCKQCKCSQLEWNMDEHKMCNSCGHSAIQHVSVFNQEILNPIIKYGAMGPGAIAFKKLRLITSKFMLRRLKKDHMSAMDLPVKEININREFFSEVENDFARSIMTNTQRQFDTYVARGVMLNQYANIFGLLMQMRQIADHPDLILKKNAEGGQNIMVCCICDEPAEDAIRSKCRHDFCRGCARDYMMSSKSNMDELSCPMCHIPLSIDLEQPEIEQDQAMVKKSSIINRIKMEEWTSSSKIETLVYELHKLRSDKATHKSIVFSNFTSMLQLIEWRLRRAGVTTVMLDGSMTPAQRQASIDHFMKNPEVECFLVSMKAGGVALNLTEASHVFIVDPWWNPAAEWQSADRCHRIGQGRPCTITRLCIEDSVESRIVQLQEKKTNMIHSTVNGDDKAMKSLSPEDMQFLFRGS